MLFEQTSNIIIMSYTTLAKKSDSTSINGVGVPEDGNRKRGRLTKTWQKTFTEDLTAMEMPRMKPKILRKTILGGEAHHLMFQKE